MYTILVIEDDKRIAGLLKRGLAENDYNVCVENDGTKGEKTALEKDFDLIIIDIILPLFNPGTKIRSGIGDHPEKSEQQ